MRRAGSILVAAIMALMFVISASASTVKIPASGSGFNATGATMLRHHHHSRWWWRHHRHH
jgi:hypothetical protein